MADGPASREGTSWWAWWQTLPGVLSALATLLTALAALYAVMRPSPSDVRTMLSTGGAGVAKHAPAASNWVSAEGGQIPQHAFAGGTDENGDPLYVCQAKYAGGLDPGWIKQDLAGCKITWGGKVLTVNSYNVLVPSSNLRWEEVVTTGKPLASGQEESGELLFVCRASYQGGLYPGKVRPGFGGCYIAAGVKGDSEVVVPAYQTLAEVDE